MDKELQNTLEERSKTVEQFNDSCPVGTEVIYTWPDGREIQTVVRFAASLLAGHTPVVWVHGVSGSVDLDNVRRCDD
jgi:hypothetical protein